MAKEKVKNIPVESVLATKRKRQDKQQYRRLQAKLRKVSIFIAVVFLALIYLALPFSKTESIEVVGNFVFSKQSILELAKTKPNSYFYWNVPWLLEHRLMSTGWFEEASVRLLKQRTIQIQVKEKKKLAYFQNGKEYFVLFADGRYQQVKDSSILTSLPILMGFESEEQRRLLSTALKDLSPERIDAISEIVQYSLAYDPEGIKFVMKNGGYMIASFASASQVGDFDAIYHKTIKKDFCIYATEKENTAYSSECPWKKSVENVTWRKDASGNPLVNQSGDFVMEHVYYDASGKPALDAQGQSIKIPVNDHGYEVPDKNFAKNYEAGYYKSGKLEKKK